MSWTGWVDPGVLSACVEEQMSLAVSGSKLSSAI